MMRSIREKLVSTALAGVGAAAIGMVSVPALADGMLSVNDFVLTHGISQREPVSETSGFRIEDGRAFAFARIQNQGEPTEVSFVWYHNEMQHASIPLHVGVSSGWRTWSSARLRPGNWRVQLVNAQGEVISERAFAVEPGSGDSFAMQGQAQDQQAMEGQQMEGQPMEGQQ